MLGAQQSRLLVVVDAPVLFIPYMAMVTAGDSAGVTQLFPILITWLFKTLATSHQHPVVASPEW